MKLQIILRHPFFKVILAFGTFLLIVGFGTVGYIYVEDYPFLDALFMTVITISTVGYEEVRPLSSAGRVFSIILIILNLSLLTFFVSYITQYFLDGRFQEFFNRYKMNRSIQHLKDHVIICGYGRNGKEAANLILKNKVPVVILEKNDPKLDEELPLRYYVHADATQDESLQFAGVHNAGALITTLPDDADNLFIVLTAREMNPGLRIIARASHDSSIRKLKTAGASEVIMPDKIGGIHMANLVINPDVKEFIDYMAAQESDTQISEISVSKNVELSSLDCWNRTGALVLGLRDSEKNYYLNPSAGTILNAGDRLIVLGHKKQIEKVKELVR
ncbi:MAG: NAD-binding protein [Bacteroidetes bacterium]|nr:NAD-binding protein [Bacteroidota bacterium]